MEKMEYKSSEMDTEQVHNIQCEHYNPHNRGEMNLW